MESVAFPLAISLEWQYVRSEMDPIGMHVGVMCAAACILQLVDRRTDARGTVVIPTREGGNAIRHDS